MGDAGHDRDLWKQRCERAEAEARGNIEAIMTIADCLNLETGKDGPVEVMAAVGVLIQERDSARGERDAAVRERDEWHDLALSISRHRQEDGMRLATRVGALEKAMRPFADDYEIRWERNKLGGVWAEVEMVWLKGAWEALGGGGFP